MTSTLTGCLNNYSEEEIYNLFGMDDQEMKVCSTCDKFIKESGIYTCKYLVDRVSMLNKKKGE